MQLNTEQQELVTDHRHLILAVLKDLQIGGAVGIYAREDLYQIGSLGLCKAAYYYKPCKATFGTFAYLCIRNQIYDAMKYAHVRNKRQATDHDWERYRAPEGNDDCSRYLSLRQMLKDEGARLKGVAGKGVNALLLWDEGYSYHEIGRMYGVPENHVRAWVARAREKIRPLLEEAA